MLSSFAPQTYQGPIAAAASSLINPILPTIGLLIVALIFLASLLRGTKIYGILLMILGLTLASYVFVAFQGGTVSVTVPRGVIQNVAANVTVQLTSLMLLLMIPSLLTIVKGGVLFIRRDRR